MFRTGNYTLWNMLRITCMFPPRHDGRDRHTVSQDATAPRGHAVMLEKEVHIVEHVTYNMHVATMHDGRDRYDSDAGCNAREGPF
jgi:hypothetical protein